MSGFSIYLPFPPSVNALYSTNFKTKRRFKSKKYEAWSAEADTVILTFGRPKQPLSGELLIEYGFHKPKGNYKRDLLNYEKAVTDWLVAREYIKDDSMIVQARLAWVADEGEEGCVFVRVVEL